MSKDLDKYIQDQILFELRRVYPRYNIEVGRGDRVMVDDKVIKGILFTPSRKRYELVDDHIIQIIHEIGEDIKRGRFTGLVD
jgi:uncharacterized protein YxjI